MPPQPRTMLSPVTIELGAGRTYDVHFDVLASVPNRLEELGHASGRCLVITDENVAEHYLSPLTEGLKEAEWFPKAIVLPPGEQTKSAEALGEIYDEALTWGIDRQTPVLALGGGVVGDLAGFAAATLLRGVPLVQLPTSLIAQVDSAVGGKTGINHAVGKNLIGAFYQPDLVLTDLQTLTTLPEREWTSGLAEVVKHALIASPSLFDRLRRNWEAILARRPEAIAPVIRQAVAIKARVVGEDEREAGRRMILNFGHTFAHAIERVAGYGTFTHGEAVAVGMRAAIHLSHQAHPDLPLEEIQTLVRALPVSGDPSALPEEDLFEAMQYDKKGQRGTPRFVLLRQIGQAYVTDDITRESLRAAWAAAIRR